MTAAIFKASGFRSLISEGDLYSMIRKFVCTRIFLKNKALADIVYVLLNNK